MYSFTHTHTHTTGVKNVVEHKMTTKAACVISGQTLTWNNWHVIQKIIIPWNVYKATYWKN